MIMDLESSVGHLDDEEHSKFRKLLKVAQGPDKDQITDDFMQNLDITKLVPQGSVQSSSPV